MQPSFFAGGLLGSRSLVVLVAALAGCSSEVVSTEKTTCDVDTGQLKVSLSAQAQGATTQFYAAVFSNGNLPLGCGDTFTVQSGSERTVLQREAASGSGPIHYIGSVPAPSVATTYTFSFERTAPRSSAPSSRVYLPAAFTLIDASTRVKIPSESIQFRLDPPMAVDVELAPSTVRLRIVVEGPCLDGEQTYLWAPKVLFPPLIKADGSVILDTRFFKRKGTDASCEAKLRIAELTAGELDPALHGISGVSDAEGSRHQAELPLHIDW